MSNRVIHTCLLGTVVAFTFWSGYQPKERFTWLMEVFPAIIGGIILVASYSRFQFTTLSYVLAWMFALILATGGHWTYAEVPLGNWARDIAGFSRNHFDRLGHVFQGVVPAMFARELLLRTSPLKQGKWLMFICISIALAISAMYELFEWQYAVIFGGSQAESFLGSQGDPWDAQTDMFMALLGAVVSTVLLGRWQDRQIAGIASQPDSGRRPWESRVN